MKPHFTVIMTKEPDWNKCQLFSEEELQEKELLEMQKQIFEDVLGEECQDNYDYRLHGFEWVEHKGTSTQKYPNKDINVHSRIPRNKR